MNADQDTTLAMLKRLDSLCAEPDSSEQIAKLEQLLVSNPLARRLYARWSQYEIDVRLVVKAEETFGLTPFVEAAIAVEAVPGWTTDWPSSARKANGKSRVQTAWQVSAAVAKGLGYAATTFASSLVRNPKVSALLVAGVLLAFWGGFTWLVTGGRGDPVANKPVVVAKAAVVVGRITSAIDCQWGDDRKGLKNGDQLKSGPFTLLAGVVEITFDTGTKLSIAAPAELIIDDVSAVELKLGRLAARVSPKGVGFAVRTPTAQMIDLGTEFGVHVGQGGDTALHVFSGSVAIHPGTETVPRQNWHVLHQGQAARVTEDNCQLNLPARVSEFVVPKDVATFEHLSHAGPRREGLVLWLAADSIDRRDQTQVRPESGVTRLVRWPNLVSLAANFEDVSQPASAHQPLLVSEAINGMPAVRFDRSRRDALLNDQKNVVVPGAPRTLFVVGRAQIRDDRVVGGSLLTFNRPTEGNQHVFSTSQFFSGPFYEKDRYIVYSDGVTGDQNGSTTSMSSEIVRPFVCVFRSAGTGSQIQVDLNGQSLPVQAGMISKEAGLSGFLLGARGLDFIDEVSAWDGDLAEVLVYDRVLSNEQTREVSAFLASKYQLVQLLMLATASNP